MVDDVETVLRQIRERVRATAPPTVVRASGGETSVFTESERALARLESTLPTLERTLDKLPPISSYRRGWLARLELWLKRQIKRATHWYTWEQVNFNAATHSALRDLQTSLRLYEQLLRDAQSEMRQIRDEVNLLGANTQAANAQVANTQAANTQYARQIEDARREARERAENILNEQRVCFRQLALEASETAVATDRLRRNLQLRLDELAHRIDELHPAHAGRQAVSASADTRGETEATS